MFGSHQAKNIFNPQIFISTFVCHCLPLIQSTVSFDSKALASFMDVHADLSHGCLYMLRKQLVGWHGLFQLFQFIPGGVVGWCEGVMYLMSLGRPADIGLQLGKACYPCSR